MIILLRPLSLLMIKIPFFYCRYIDLIVNNINGNPENKNSVNDREALLESM